MRTDRRLRVVFLDHTAAPSGAELALLTTLEHLDVDRHVILGADGPLHRRFARVAGVDVVSMPPGLGAATRDAAASLVGPGLLAHAAVLSRRLRALHPDVVYANSLRAGVYGSLAAATAGYPLVWHVRDHVSAEHLGQVRAAALRRLIATVSTRVIANSESTADTLRSRRYVTVIPSPLSGSPTIDRPTRTSGPLVYVTASRLSPWKGQDTFLRAFAEAFPRGPQRAVVLGAALFGEQVYERSLRSLVGELGIASRVDFLGHQDDVMGELADVDVLVHSPNLTEPFGRVVVEGLAAGVVVVARGDGGPAETVRHEVDGLLYPPGREDELVQLLRRVDGDAALRTRLVAAGRVRAAAFAPALVAARVLAVCQAAAAARGRRRDAMRAV